MWIEMGNSHAIEGYSDPKSENPDEVLFRHVKGDQTTTFQVPDNIPLTEVLNTVVALHTHTFAKRTTKEGGYHPPAWIDSDNEVVRMVLSEHFGLPKDHTVPKTWRATTTAHSTDGSKGT